MTMKVLLNTDITKQPKADRKMKRVKEISLVFSSPRMN